VTRIDIVGNLPAVNIKIAETLNYFHASNSKELAREKQVNDKSDKGSTVEKEFKKQGRPSSYNQEQADEIIELITNGASLRDIADMGYPSAPTLFRWMESNEDFRKQYARAREEQAEFMVSEIINIADTEEDPAKARNRIDARKWAAMKLLPKVYGDRQEVNINQTVSIAHAEALMTLAARAKEAKQLQAPTIELEAQRFVDPIPPEEDQ